MAAPSWGGVFSEFSMQFPYALFRQAGLTPSDVAALCDVSRVTGWRWMRGDDDGAEVGVNIFLQERVARATACVRKAVEAGVLPDMELIALPTAKRVDKLKDILRPYWPTK